MLSAALGLKTYTSSFEWFRLPTSRQCNNFLPTCTLPAPPLALPCCLEVLPAQESVSNILDRRFNIISNFYHCRLVDSQRNSYLFRNGKNYAFLHRDQCTHPEFSINSSKSDSDKAVSFSCFLIIVTISFQSSSPGTIKLVGSVSVAFNP